VSEVITDVMENPYHQVELKPHHLDRAEARVTCFDIFNIVAASQTLGGEFEMAEQETDTEPSSLFKLHHDLAETRLSQLLLRLAVFVRTFDDVMREAAPELYDLHVAATDGANFIGDLDGTDLRLREACNKIIHAIDFRPVYDHADREQVEGEVHRVWFMTGEIEIGGMRGSHQWRATLVVQNFLEVTLERVAFELPAEAVVAVTAAPAALATGPS
jgi:hypothetical protein